MAEPCRRRRSARPSPPPRADRRTSGLAQGLLTLEHALAFYPEGHQSRQAPLERLLALLRAEAAITGEGALGFAGELLHWRGGLYDELPAAARKLAALLGARGIARLSWTPELTAGGAAAVLRPAGARPQRRPAGWDQAARFEHLRVEGLDYEALMAQDAEDGEAGLSAERNLWQALLLRTLADPAAEPTAEELELLRENWGDPAALAALLRRRSAPARRPATRPPSRRCGGLPRWWSAPQPPGSRSPRGRARRSWARWPAAPAGAAAEPARGRAGAARRRALPGGLRRPRTGRGHRADRPHLHDGPRPDRAPDPRLPAPGPPPARAHGAGAAAAGGDPRRRRPRGAARRQRLGGGPGAADRGGGGVHVPGVPGAAAAAGGPGGGPQRRGAVPRRTAGAGRRIWCRRGRPRSPC